MKNNNNFELHRQVRVKLYIFFIVMKIEILERLVHVKYSHVVVIIEDNEVNYSSSLTNHRLVKWQTMREKICVYFIKFSLTVRLFIISKFILKRKKYYYYHYWNLAKA